MHSKYFFETENNNRIPSTASSASMSLISDFKKQVSQRISSSFINKKVCLNPESTSNSIAISSSLPTTKFSRPNSLPALPSLSSLLSLHTLCANKPTLTFSSLEKLEPAVPELSQTFLEPKTQSSSSMRIKANPQASLSFASMSPAIPLKPLGTSLFAGTRLSQPVSQPSTTTVSKSALQSFKPPSTSSLSSSLSSSSSSSLWYNETLTSLSKLQDSDGKKP